MTADIAKARNSGESTPVYAPVYDAPISTAYSEIANAPITNQEREIKGREGSILNTLDCGTRMLDISGRTVGMVTSINGETYRDVVEVVGETKASYIVKIDGVDYAVRKSIVRFVTGVY